MTPNTEHYLLFSEASCSNGSRQAWRFVLQNVETQRRFSATDSEPTGCGERLELLAVVRGLEALDGPAHDQVDVALVNLFDRMTVAAMAGLIDGTEAAANERASGEGRERGQRRRAMQQKRRRRTSGERGRS